MLAFLHWPLLAIILLREMSATSLMYHILSKFNRLDLRCSLQWVRRPYHLALQWHQASIDCVAECCAHEGVRWSGGTVCLFLINRCFWRLEVFAPLAVRWHMSRASFLLGSHHHVRIHFLKLEPYTVNPAIHACQINAHSGTGVTDCVSESGLTSHVAFWT